MSLQSDRNCRAMHGYLREGCQKTRHSSMTSAITTMAGSEAAEATGDVLGIKSLLLARGVVAGKNDKTGVLPWFGRTVKEPFIWDVGIL